MLLTSRVDRPPRDDDRVRLDAILARRQADTEKLIYAGFGSILSTDRDLLRRLVEAVAEVTDWELVISLSRRLKAAELGALPSNVHAFDWVPQPRVLENADAAITHGGINTIDECVLHCVPMLIYCGFETDMAGNTARVVHHGIGLAGDRQDPAEAIRRRLDRLLGEPSFAEHLSRLQKHYLAYQKERRAERIVETLLARPVEENG